MCGDRACQRSAAGAWMRNGATHSIMRFTRRSPATVTATSRTTTDCAICSKAILEGYVYDWRFSKVRKRFHGSSSKGRPGSQFVMFTQNHDQVANALVGKRPVTLTLARPGESCRGGADLRAEYADAVHGPGVRRDHAVHLLHRFSGSGMGESRQRGPQEGVRKISRRGLYRSAIAKKRSTLRSSIGSNWRNRNIRTC